MAKKHDTDLERNDEEEEYHFEEPELLHELPPEEDILSPLPQKETAQANVSPEGNLRRIVWVGAGILGLLLLYEAGSFVLEKTRNWNKQGVNQEQLSPPPAMVPPTQPQSMNFPPPAPAPEAALSPRLNETISNLTESQQSLQASISSLNSRLDDISTSMQNITDKMNGINQGLSQILSKLEAQSAELATLRARSVKPQSSIKPPSMGSAPSSYYIQAIIPGRAWLLSSTGLTLTVREGTPLPGYGVIRLIDPNQGRVMTSSGKVIRFSQQDS